MIGSHPRPQIAPVLTFGPWSEQTSDNPFALPDDHFPDHDELARHALWAVRNKVLSAWRQRFPELVAGATI
ncbi:hypothetical protein [Dyella sp.]|uniref:hypothetical protein n=1 Tax=Dyella sp. TaxID=1869338 RepID=UPI002ED3E970